MAWRDFDFLGFYGLYNIGAKKFNCLEGSGRQLRYMGDSVGPPDVRNPACHHMSYRQYSGQSCHDQFHTPY